MAIKKSELYSSLWSSCDELRGGMDASQYKDYVLVMLFIKYVSDKYADVPYAPITIPKGASFKDMVALKGKSDIGDQINKKILEPLAKENKLSDIADFNSEKLGDGQEKVERLTNLISIFENKALDFSKNRAEGDDILGDAYEYLMRHFATESGKSKGQFYTPAEVSRVMAQIIGIREANTTNNTTVYDPTCGSGSLLLKVGDEAKAEVTLYGQEKDTATSGLARMNMILHNKPTALIKGGHSTLANPLYTGEDGKLKTFDYVVANPPFSDKRWSTGIDPLNDQHERFQHYGTPPAKQGDYAYLLHIVRSLKSTGIAKGDIVICPDGSGTYHVGEVTGEYRFVAGESLPHQRPVSWLPVTISRADMSEALRNSTGSIGTVSEVSRYRDELEKLIGGVVVHQIISTDGTVEDPSVFALEKYLEDFLVTNWAQTELGKTHDIFEEDGQLVGQQYATDTGPMDILAIRKDKKELLVVELKKGRASDAVVGQVLRYMGYVKQELAETDQTVRGVIIALEDAPRLRRALVMTPHIDFYRYQISFKLLKS